MLRKLKDVLLVAGCSRDDYNNWLRRDYVREPRREGHGVPVGLTQAQALELAFLAALNRVGFEPADASKLGRKWAREAAQESFGRFAAIAPDSEPFQFNDPTVTIDDLAVTLGEPASGWVSGVGDPGLPATEIVLIDRGTIRDRIIKLYS